jgi:hypothetical protein
MAAVAAKAWLGTIPIAAINVMRRIMSLSL